MPRIFPILASCTTWIAIGLALLLLGSFSPNAPIVTGLAIIATGATEATALRTRLSASTVPLMLIHGTTYATLYALFVGARLHAALAAPGTGASNFAVFDVAVSILPMVFAARQFSSSLRDSLLSRP